jgi:hypothetical protein
MVLPTERPRLKKSAADVLSPRTGLTFSSSGRPRWTTILDCLRGTGGRQYP